LLMLISSTMTINVHLTRSQETVAMLLHFGLLASLSWKLTRYSAELAVNALLVLSCLGQIILIFGFATHRLEYIVAAALCYLWVSWTFLGYVAELDTSDRITLSVCNPIFALISVYFVFLAVS